jgi:hypothetical protein
LTFRRKWKYRSEPGTAPEGIGETSESITILFPGGEVRPKELPFAIDSATLMHRYAAEWNV